MKEIRQKIEILNEIPDASLDEINEYKDFDAFLKDVQMRGNQQTSSFVSGKIFFGLSLIIISLTAYFISNKASVDNDKTTTKSATPEQVIVSNPSDKQEKSPEPKDHAVITDQTKAQLIELAKAAPVEKLKNEKKKDKQLLNPVEIKEVFEKANQPNEAVKEEKKEKQIVPVADVFLKAEPLFGYDHLYQHIANNLVYPIEHEEDSIEGLVLVSFIIKADSVIDKIKIVQSLKPAFDKEAIRVVESMPNWRPASYNGQPYTSSMKIPIRFRVNSTTTNPD